MRTCIGVERAARFLPWSGEGGGDADAAPGLNVLMRVEALSPNACPLRVLDGADAACSGVDAAGADGRLRAGVSGCVRAVVRAVCVVRDQSSQAPRKPGEYKGAVTPYQRSFSSL